MRPNSAHIHQEYVSELLACLNNYRQTLDEFARGDYPEVVQSKAREALSRFLPLDGPIIVNVIQRKESAS